MGQAKHKSAYLAKTKRLLRQLGAAKDPAHAAVAAQALHTAFLARLFAEDELAQFAYREALGHADEAVRAGLARYLDAFFSFGWFHEEGSPLTLTLATLWEVRTRNRDVVADLHSTSAIAGAVSDALGVPVDQMEVYPQLTDINAYDGFSELASWVGVAKSALVPVARENFRFGDDAGPGVYRTVLVKVFPSDEAQCQELAERLAEPNYTTELPPVQAPYELCDLTGKRDIAEAFCTLCAVGLPFTLSRDTAFHEAHASWQRWAKAAGSKGRPIESLAVNIVISDQGPVSMPTGAIPTSAQEPGDPQVALLIGDVQTQEALDAVLYYEGPHALLAIPDAAAMLVAAGVGKVFIGGSPVNP